MVGEQERVRDGAVASVGGLLDDELRADVGRDGQQLAEQVDDGVGVLQLGFVALWWG